MMFYALALFNVFVAAVAQMLLKKAAITPHKSFVKEYLNPWVIGGYSLMVFSLVSSVYVLSQGVLLKELGTIEAASYLFVPALAFVCFKKKNQPAKSHGNRAYPSGRRRVLLGVIPKTSIIYSSFIVTKFLN